MTVATMEETKTDTAVVNLSQTAADKLLAIMTEKGLRETHALRVFVSGGGCSGMQYGMTFDDNPRPVDMVFKQHGLRMVVDPRSLPYITGANIDYEDSLMGGGFHIENPNAVSSCGCGQSFRTKEGGAAEGGSCSSCH
jgi:iron-sulfur cluster assembly accessory protein